MERLRTPFLLAAIVLALLVFVLEVGSSLFPGSPVTPEQVTALILEQGFGDELDGVSPPEGEGVDPSTGIAELAVLDGLVLFTLVLIGSGALFPQAVHGRVQGGASCIVAILAILAVIGLGLMTLAELLLMVGLLLAVPFGTLVYLAKWGFFDRGSASALLATLLFLKLACGVCLVLAHQRHLRNIGLVLILVTSLVANVVVSFLHGLVPVILVSITDRIAGIVGLILGLIWAIVLLIGAVVSIVKVLRLTRTG